jgi:uncharacterized protein (TIGR03000 family)
MAMLKRFRWGATVLLMAGAALLLQPQVSEAQRRGGGGNRGGGGYRSGGGVYRGGGGGYRGDYNYAPTYSGTQSYQSFYPPESTTDTSPNAVHMLVVVPDPNAQVFIDGNPTQQTGNEREFVTDMAPGTTGTYHVKARWTESGRTREEVRNVNVRPGAWRVVDFTQSQGTANSAPNNRTVGTPVPNTTNLQAPTENRVPATPAVNSAPRGATTNPNLRPGTPASQNPRPPEVVTPRTNNPAPIPDNPRP